MFPALVDEDGVVVPPTVDGAAFEAVFAVSDAVIIAEVIVAVARPHPKSVDHDGVANDVAWSVDKRRPHDDRIDDDRGEQHAAAGNGQVPVAGDVDVAARRPNVVRRNPDVTRLHAGPVTRAPEVAAATPFPEARDIEALRRWRLAGRGDVRRCWRRGQVGDLLRSLFLLGRGRPEPRHPLHAAFDFLPIPSHPVSARRRRPPHAAHPEIVIPLVVPRPVTADPGHIAVGLLLRRHFVNRLGRPFRHDLGRHGLRGRCGERLVDRPAGQHLDALGNGRRLGGGGGLLAKRWRHAANADEANNQHCPDNEGSHRHDFISVPGKTGNLGGRCL